MATEYFVEDAEVHCDSVELNLPNLKSASDAAKVSHHDTCGNFECNICLDCVQDPVVTLCGHLYCWPCIYEWLRLQNISFEDDGDRYRQCPVCKAEVSHSTLVPLYGQGRNKKAPRGKNPYFPPRKPLGPIDGFDVPRPSQAAMNRQLSRQYNPYQPPQAHLYYPAENGFHVSPSTMATNTRDPVIRMFSEMVNAGLFGSLMTNVYTHSNSYQYEETGNPRIRRHMVQADKSLSRIYFFLVCCTALCLLLF